jgi:CRP-like cAMP-binding protein
MSFQNSLFLDGLAQNEHQALKPHLSRTHLEQHRVLFDTRERVTQVYFPTDSVVSLVVPLATGEVIESAMVGRDGLIGGAGLFNGKISLNRAVVQVAGDCFQCDVGALIAAAKEYPGIQKRVGTHEQALLGQTQQSAACNATHQVENRLARWLLRAADLHGGDDLPLTQEYLAEMLGVRRTSVTLVARTLQKAGFIEYIRGRIKLLDIPGLQETACECYQTVKLNYDTLMRPQSNV